MLLHDSSLQETPIADADVNAIVDATKPAGVDATESESVIVNGPVDIAVGIQDADARIKPLYHLILVKSGYSIFM